MISDDSGQDRVSVTTHVADAFPGHARNLNASLRIHAHVSTVLYRRHYWQLTTVHCLCMYNPHTQTQYEVTLLLSLRTGVCSSEWKRQTETHFNSKWPLSLWHNQNTPCQHLLKWQSMHFTAYRGRPRGASDQRHALNPCCQWSIFHKYSKKF